MTASNYFRNFRNFACRQTQISNICLAVPSLWRGIMHLTYHDSHRHTSVVSGASASEAGAPDTICCCRLKRDEALSHILAELKDWDRRFDRAETIAGLILDRLSEECRDMDSPEDSRTDCREG